MTSLLIVLPYSQRLPQLLAFLNFGGCHLVYLMGFQQSLRCRLVPLSTARQQLLP